LREQGVLFCAVRTKLHRRSVPQNAADAARETFTHSPENSAHGYSGAMLLEARSEPCWRNGVKVKPHWVPLLQAVPKDEQRRCDICE
jgi:hypothetical protein